MTTQDTASTPAAAFEAARSFVEAIAWGEHRRLWELLAPEGRKIVLRVATNHGMDEGLAARLRDGTAGAAESEEFLTNLLAGLRADLQGTDLDALEYSGDPLPEPMGDRARVVLVAPLPEPLAFRSGSGLPVGTMELVAEEGTWRVERLIPNAVTK